MTTAIFRTDSRATNQFVTSDFDCCTRKSCAKLSASGPQTGSKVGGRRRAPDDQHSS